MLVFCFFVCLHNRSALDQIKVSVPSSAKHTRFWIFRHLGTIWWFLSPFSRVIFAVFVIQLYKTEQSKQEHKINSPAGFPSKIFHQYDICAWWSRCDVISTVPYQCLCSMYIRFPNQLIRPPFNLLSSVSWEQHALTNSDLAKTKAKLIIWLVVGHTALIHLLVTCLLIHHIFNSKTRTIFFCDHQVFSYLVDQFVQAFQAFPEVPSRLVRYFDHLSL